MIAPVEIIAQLQQELPRNSPLFHDTITPTSATVSSGILTVTLANHGLSMDDQVFANDYIIRNKITAVILTSDNTLRFTTENDHDLTAAMTARITRNWPPGESVDIENIQEYTLDETAAGVPAKNMFETTPGFTLPVLSGDEFLLENRPLGVNGFQTITSATTNTFTIDLTDNTDAPPVPDGDLVIGTMITSIRVALVPDISRAKEIYTRQSPDQIWCFVIMTDREASKSRNNDDDMISLPGSTLRELNIIENFSLLVIIPTNKTLSGTQAINLAVDDIFKALLKSLYGWKCTGFGGDGISEYNTTFYSHAYDFWVRDRIDFEDGWENTSTVAFRILDFTQTVFDEGTSNANIELQD